MNDHPAYRHDAPKIKAHDPRPGDPPDPMNDTKIKHSAPDVAAFLAGIDRTSAEPVEVTIGRTTFVGARFTQERDTPIGTRAHAEGRRTYDAHGLYLLGEMPASYRHRNASVYVDQYGARWYVGRYATAETASDARYAEYHPLGAWFQLMIDKDAAISGASMPISVEAV